MKKGPEFSVFFDQKTDHSSKWLVETENSSSESNIICTSGRKLVQICSNIFGQKFWKIDDNFELARSILMKVVAFGVKGM